MNAAARRLGQGVIQEIGVVVRCDRSDLAVRLEGGERPARRAASCLLEPAVGDLVHVVCSPRGERWVLSVLERDETTPAVLACDGDLSLRSRRGSLTFGAERLGLAAKEVDIASGTLRASATSTELVTKEGALVAGKLRVDVEAIALFASAVETLAERIVQRARRVLRRVEETDELRAGRIDHAARATYRLHAEHALVTAEGLVKLDAAQVHLG